MSTEKGSYEDVVEQLKAIREELAEVNDKHEKGVKNMNPVVQMWNTSTPGTRKWMIAFLIASVEAFANIQLDTGITQTLFGLDIAGR